VFTRQGTSVNPVALILLVGVALAGYSAYLSFTYLTKAKKEGLGALDGWAQLNAFYEHATWVPGAQPEGCRDPLLASCGAGQRLACWHSRTRDCRPAGNGDGASSSACILAVVPSAPGDGACSSTWQLLCQRQGNPRAERCCWT
jgi:hypothetical protein